MILGPCPSVKTILFSLIKTKSRVVTGLLPGHNTLRRRQHLMGMIYNPLCMRRLAEEETTSHVLFQCVDLASFIPCILGFLLSRP